MNAISFFTPAYYPITHQKSLTQSMGEWVDSYLYLGGKQAFVVTPQESNGAFGVELKEGPLFCDELCITALKIASYCTILLPLIALCIKVIVRKQYTFHTESTSRPLPVNSSTTPERNLNLISPITPGSAKSNHFLSTPERLHFEDEQSPR